jgi:hypothetical protein
MLDEDEFAVIGDLYSQALGQVQKFREQQDTTLSETPVDFIFAPVKEKYKELTGVNEDNHVAIMHHRMSMYGPECKYCGKPLRTAKASVCAGCGRDQEQ